MLKIIIAIALAIAACSPTTVTLTIDSSEAQVPTDGMSAPTFDGTHWTIGSSTSVLRYPCALEVGDQIIEAIVYGRRASSEASSRGVIERLETVSQLHFAIGPEATAPAPVTPDLYTSLEMQAVEEQVVNEDHTYSIAVRGNGIAGDSWANADVTVLR